MWVYANKLHVGHAPLELILFWHCSSSHILFKSNKTLCSSSKIWKHWHRLVHMWEEKLPEVWTCQLQCKHNWSVSSGKQAALAYQSSLCAGCSNWSLLDEMGHLFLQPEQVHLCTGVFKSAADQSWGPGLWGSSTQKRHCRCTHTNTHTHEHSYINTSSHLKECKNKVRQIQI